MSVWKKRIRLGLMMTALLTLAWGLALAALSYPFLSTTTDSVRLRKSASKTAMVMDTVPSGAQVEVLEKTGSFFRVRYNGQTGYVAAEDVRTEIPEKTLRRYANSAGILEVKIPAEAGEVMVFAQE